MDFAYVAFGLIVLLAGARYFVGGIAAIAAALGAPPLVIGMTVVAFGTSTPELVVNALSAARGSTDLAFGNVTGSCIVNIGFVLAVTAMIRPMKVEPSLITREIPMLIVACLAIWALGNDQLLDGAAASAWSRIDGLILLLFFAIFLYYTARQAMAARSTDAFISEVQEEADRAAKPRSLWIEGALTIAGLIGVSIGAQLTVDGAVNLARGFGLSEAVIGLTVISLGTTLPELATCVMAAKRGDADIALGNVVGSNIFNLLGIGGLVSTIKSVPIPPSGQPDLLMMAALTIVLLPVAIRSERTITRGEGAFLFLAFAAYLGWRVSTALAAAA